MKIPAQQRKYIFNNENTFTTKQILVQQRKYLHKQIKYIHNKEKTFTTKKKPSQQSKYLKNKRNTCRTNGGSLSWDQR